MVNLHISVDKVNMYLEFSVRDEGIPDVALVNSLFTAVNRPIKFQIKVSNWLKRSILKLQRHFYRNVLFHRNIHITYPMNYNVVFHKTCT